MRICNRVSLALALTIAASAPRARAQAEDQAAARTLFDEGRRLLKAGDYAEACPKLEAAGKLYPSAGILLNLGDCYEKQDRIASAWTEFGESAAAGERANRHDQAIEGKRRQLALEPKLSRLTIRVPHEVAGLVVKRDGTVLSAAAWGYAIPVDSGRHEIRGEAPEHEPWTIFVSMTKPGQTVAVDVPELTASPVAAPGPLAPTVEPAAPQALADVPPPRSRPRTLGFVLLGTGAVVGIAGGVLMGVEAGRASTARKSDTTPADSAASGKAWDSTRTPYDVGITGVIVGAVVASSGLLLATIVHGKGSPASAVRAAPWVASGGGGFAIAGGW